MQGCSAGDSAAYQRRNTSLDDVVIVAAVRTPLTKVSQDHSHAKVLLAAFATRPSMSASLFAVSDMMLFVFVTFENITGQAWWLEGY